MLNTRWRKTDAPDGGIWFISELGTPAGVIAPPGVRISLAERCDPFAPGAVRGWRLLELGDDCDPLLLDSRDTSPISTMEAIRLLGPSWVAEVQEIMLSQLQTAASLCKRPDGLPINDELALAGSLATRWILGELDQAFPDVVWQLPDAPPQAEPVPDFSDEFLMRVPAPATLLHEHTAMASADRVDGLKRMGSVQLLATVCAVFVELVKCRARQVLDARPHTPARRPPAPDVASPHLPERLLSYARHR